MRDDTAILKRLENKALHYLGRYATTEARLRQVLGRFAQRKMEDEDPERMIELIDKMVSDCAAKGFVNDKDFAEQKTASLRRQGSSRNQIKNKLYERGVNSEVIKQTIDDHDAAHDHDVEVQSALIYARKRRLGPYAQPRSGQNDMTEGWGNLHAARFARAGFSHKTVIIIMGIETPDDAEELFNEGFYG